MDARAGRARCARALKRKKGRTHGRAGGAVAEGNRVTTEDGRVWAVGCDGMTFGSGRHRSHDESGNRAEDRRSAFPDNEKSKHIRTNG